MEMKKSLWMDGFVRYDFKFEDRDAILVLPKEENRTDRWLLKTEYFEAFQEMELAMVRRGWHLAYLKNINRWGLEADMDAKARFRDFLVKEFGLNAKCVPVGMSCGGLHGIKTAASHPDMVACLYLDAPVVNLLSCPCCLGAEPATGSEMIPEMLAALGLNMSQMISYREHPMDRIPVLIENRIPVALVWGDADMTVPFSENGALVKAAYEKTDIPAFWLCKPGVEHHPHGPGEAHMDAVIAFIEENCK